jgi:hypothetical protein
MPHTAEHGISQQMQACIDECLRCYAACESTATHCLMLGGKHAEAKHIGSLRDCADICKTAAGFMLRGSGLHGQVCRVCADACEACAKSCQRIDATDPTMRECAETCRTCAKSCASMAKMKA